MRAKVTQIGVTVSPYLKEQIWKEASRLHITPSAWIRGVLRRGLSLSSDTPAPEKYAITLKEKQAVALRKQGFRIEYHPIPEEEA